MAKSTTSSLSDEQLMLRYQQGEVAAFEALYQRHGGRVYGYLDRRLGHRYRTDEVFQEVFLKLHRSRGRYDASFPFLPWLFTLCRNTLIDHLRTERRQPTVLLDETIDIEDLGQAGEAAWNEGLFQHHALNPRQRTALALRYQEDLPFAAIAEALDTTEPNARQLVSRALRTLRQWLQRSKADD